MAIDTRDDRTGAAAFRLQLLGLRRILPEPDGAISTADRAQLARAYSGFADWAEGVGTGTTSKMMRHTHRLLRHR